MPPHHAIECPKCGKGLKLRDPAVSRGRVQCPACGHRFQFESAAPARAATGTSTHVDAPQADVGQEPIFLPLDDTPSHNALAFDKIETVDVPQSGPVMPFVPAAINGESGVARIQAIRRRSRHRRNMFLASAAGVLVLLAVGLFVFRPSLFRPVRNAPQEVAAESGENPPSGSDADTSETNREGVDSEQDAAAANSAADTDDAAHESNAATSAGPVPLLFFPAGVRIVIHLHPAELWSTDHKRDETRACLAPLVDWGSRAIRDVSTFDPAEVAEATFGVLLKGQGIAPEIAAVIRLARETNGNDLAARFSGEFQPAESGKIAVIRSAKRVVLLVDNKTFAIGPRAFEQEMLDAATVATPTDLTVEDLISHTDRRRQFTVVCRPDDLLLYREALTGGAASDLVRSIVEWFDPAAVEGVAWSIDVRNAFDSRLLIRNRSEIAPRELRQTLRGRLDELPRQMLAAVQKMNPADPGRRQIIGRFPAMLQAGAMGTRDASEARLISWNTVLPKRAAPNLALAALLTWDESRRARSTGQTPPPAGQPSALPVSIVERLQKPIVVDFRRTPLHEAIAYISEETGVPIDLDGDGLKQAGYTRNMPQSLQLGTIPAMKCLAAIFKPYDQMVLLLDEQNGKAVVTVRAVAKARGITPLDLMP